MLDVGTEEGEICGRDGCDGVIKFDDSTPDGCSCHINPP